MTITREQIEKVRSHYLWLASNTDVSDVYEAHMHIMETCDVALSALNQEADARLGAVTRDAYGALALGGRPLLTKHSRADMVAYQELAASIALQLRLEAGHGE